MTKHHRRNWECQLLAVFTLHLTELLLYTNHSGIHIYSGHEMFVYLIIKKTNLHNISITSNVVHETLFSVAHFLP